MRYHTTATIKRCVETWDMTSSDTKPPEYRRMRPAKPARRKETLRTHRTGR